MFSAMNRIFWWGIKLVMPHLMVLAILLPIILASRYEKELVAVFHFKSVVIIVTFSIIVAIFTLLVKFYNRVVWVE